MGKKRETISVTKVTLSRVRGSRNMPKGVSQRGSETYESYVVGLLRDTQTAQTPQ